jgi:hypothetical protein
LVILKKKIKNVGLGAELPLGRPPKPNVPPPPPKKKIN